MMKYFLTLTCMMFLASCSLAPDAVIPNDRVPEKWRDAVVHEESAKLPPRWSDYGSVELEKLVKRALNNNTDIGAALARIGQARANTQIASAGLYPEVDASGTASRTTTDRRDTGSVTTRRREATLSIAYELDLWQRNHNASNSAQWQERATAYDYDALRIVVASEVARLYIGYLANVSRVAVADKNLKNAQDVLRITELRHREGAISGLELAQQRTSVANTEATIAALKNQRDLFFNQLALVTGEAPSQLSLTPDIAADGLKIPPVNLSTPWELLTQRPDIAAAEARLRAANKDIGVARANALPALSTALDAGVVGNPAGTLLSLAASFFAPIFQGGALEADIERSEASRDEQLASYQATLLTAFREVEDALSTFEAATAQRAALFTAAESARRADSIARARFDAGSIDYTTLLQTQSALLQAEDSYYNAVQGQLAAHIDLVRALGGSAD